MSKALIAGINQVAVDKGLDREVIFEAIEAALVSAYKRNYGSIANVSSEVDRITGDVRVYAEREVVDEVLNDRTEITQEEAQRTYPTAKLGDVVKVQSTPADFGRIAAQTAKQVILQRIREAERDTVFENFAHRVGEILNAQVRSNDNISGAVTVMLDDKHESLLMREDQIPNERLRRGDYIKVYVVDVHRSTRGPVIKLSRTHRNLLRRLMEQEIPEVRDGIVEIKSIAREPGARSKAAVVATVAGVDPVGSCVGMRGLRIQNIVNELSGEKIDVIEWHAETRTYISSALSPAKVSNVYLDESGSIKTAVVVVPDRQLSLAIGKEGQNARLAAKLTGWRIDIKSETEASEEGLSKLYERQLQMGPAGGDLLSVAERFLRDEDEAGEDMLSRAAKALEDKPESAPRIAEAYGVQLPPEETLPELEEGLPAGEITDDRWDVAAAMIGGRRAEPEVFGELPETAATDAEAKPAGESALPEMTTIDELPEMITGDMLRARMRQRQEAGFDAMKFEVPAELLAGLDEEEAEEADEEWEESDKKGKGKGKPAKVKAKKGGRVEAKGKAKGKKRRPDLEDADF